MRAGGEEPFGGCRLNPDANMRAAPRRCGYALDARSSAAAVFDRLRRVWVRVCTRAVSWLAVGRGL